MRLHKMQKNAVVQTAGQGIIANEKTRGLGGVRGKKASALAWTSQDTEWRLHHLGRSGGAGRISRTET